MREGWRLAQADADHGGVLVEPEDGPAQQERAVSRERARPSGVVVGRVDAPEYRVLEHVF